MNTRPYKDGEHSDVVYYVGENVEQTMAYGMQTLFLNEPRPAQMVIDIANDKKCTHVYIGAGGTFQPKSNQDWDVYEVLIESLTDAGFLVSVEHNLTQSEWFLESCWADNIMVIPVLSIVIPYIAQYGNQACMKISDEGFNKTNPGVWVHSCNTMTSTKSFTHWSKYKGDLPV
jgi:hypothetical protein